MKKHYFIYFLFLCFITTSCENTIFDRETSTTQSITKSTLNELGYYGSKFRNIKVYTSRYGSDKMVADLEVCPAIGSEYSCTLGSNLGNEGVKSIVSVTGGTIVYNGREDTYLYGTNSQINFVIKTHTSKPTVTLNFEVPPTIPDDSRVSARLVITKRQYNGENLPSVSGGYSDLNINAFYGGLPHDVGVEWICNICGTRNANNHTVCESCGRNQGSY